MTPRKSSVLLVSVPSCNKPVCSGKEPVPSSSFMLAMRWRKSGGVSDDEAFRRKKGGSSFVREGPCSRTSLLDFSNQFSALLLSPELPFPPKACKLDGESVPADSPPELGLSTCSSSEAAVVCFRRREGCCLAVCSNETDFAAGDRRGCEDGKCLFTGTFVNIESFGRLVVIFRRYGQRSIVVLPYVIYWVVPLGLHRILQSRMSKC